MAFKFVVLPDAEKQLNSLDRVVAKRILKKLVSISAQDDPVVSAKILQNSKIGDLRFRIGDYRAVAVVDWKKRVIAIVAIGHRREIYR